MLKLRGHHLICLHFFDGEGYDTAFVKNLEDVLKKAEYEQIEVSEGADDVCKMCPHLEGGICKYDEDAEREVRMMDEVALGLLTIDLNTKVRWQDIGEKIPAIFHEWHERYCNGCDWNDVCEKNDFYQELKRM